MAAESRDSMYRYVDSGRLMRPACNRCPQSRQSSAALQERPVAPSKESIVRISIGVFVLVVCAVVIASRAVVNAVCAHAGLRAPEARCRGAA